MGVSAYMREMPVVRSTDSVAPSDPPTRMTPYVVIMTTIAAATLPRPVCVVRAASVIPNIAYMNRGRSRANAMFNGLRMCDRNVARHSLPAPVKGEGIGRSVGRAGAWVVMIPSSCVVSGFVGRGPRRRPRDEAGAGSSGWAFAAHSASAWEVMRSKTSSRSSLSATTCSVGASRRTFPASMMTMRSASLRASVR